MPSRALLRPLPLLLAAGLAWSTPLRAQESPVSAPAPGRQCTRERVKPTPPLRGQAAARDSLRDSIFAAVITDARESTRAAGVAEPAGIFLLELDAARRVPRVHLAAGSNVPAEVAREVAARSIPLLARWPDRGEVSLTLRLDSIPRAEPTVGSVQVVCRPDLANRDFLRRLLEQQVGANRAVVERAGRRNTAHVKMLLARDGTVAYSEISRSAGEPLLNEMALRLVSQMRFHPASSDGVPLDVWVVLPITLHVPRHAGEGTFGEQVERSRRP